MSRIPSFLLLIALCLFPVPSSCSMSLEMQYPARLLPPVTGRVFFGEALKDELICFGNLDYLEDTYLESMLCLLQWRRDSEVPSRSCFGLWGSRHVVAEVEGSVEFTRLMKLPRERKGEKGGGALTAEHWLYLSNAFETKSSRETVKVDAEPIYICARSNKWQTGNTNSSFHLQFRNAYIRHFNRETTLQQIYLQTLVSFGMTLPTIGPVIGSIVAAKTIYVIGLNYFIAIFSSCMFFLVSAPIIFSKESRQTTRKAFRLLYFSDGSSPNVKVDDMTQRVWLFYQSLYFSSFIVCIGSISAYALFSVFRIERELRNDMLRVCLAVSAASFIYFFMAKLFPKFSTRYMWIPLSYLGISTIIKNNVNKKSQNEVLVSSYVIMLITNILYKKIAGLSMIGRMRRECTLVMESLLGNFRWPMKLYMKSAAPSSVSNDTQDSSVQQLELTTIGPLAICGIDTTVFVFLTEYQKAKKVDSINQAVKLIDDAKFCSSCNESEFSRYIEHEFEYQFSSESEATNFSEDIASIIDSVGCHLPSCRQSIVVFATVEVRQELVILRTLSDPLRCTENEDSSSNSPCPCGAKATSTPLSCMRDIKERFLISPRRYSTNASQYAKVKPPSGYCCFATVSCASLARAGLTSHKLQRMLRMVSCWDEAVQRNIRNFLDALAIPYHKPCSELLLLTLDLDGRHKDLSIIAKSSGLNVSEWSKEEVKKMEKQFSHHNISGHAGVESLTDDRMEHYIIQHIAMSSVLIALDCLLEKGRDSN